MARGSGHGDASSDPDQNAHYVSLDWKNYSGFLFDDVDDNNDDIECGNGYSGGFSAHISGNPAERLPQCKSHDICSHYIDDSWRPKKRVYVHTCLNNARCQYYEPEKEGE